MASSEQEKFKTAENKNPAAIRRGFICEADGSRMRRGVILNSLNLSWIMVAMYFEYIMKIEVGLLYLPLPCVMLTAGIV
jgi:hypothetical protein